MEMAYAGLTMLLKRTGTPQEALTSRRVLLFLQLSVPGSLGILSACWISIRRRYVPSDQSKDGMDSNASRTNLCLTDAFDPSLVEQRNGQGCHGSEPVQLLLPTVLTPIDHTSHIIRCPEKGPG